ncbi:Uncharacterised protein [Mycobacteroides abscessus subsp. abscessus]|nr:Uncharacterised protein [Mycobacteroides abscessus subsp. abscessus]SKO01017.1 Uncharacterised protein [Mycobacteroides abscessus subsp. abscessus]
MNGARATVVAGVECGKQLNHLGTTHLAHHNSVWTHPQCLTHQLTQRHLANTLDVDSARGQADHMRVTRRELCGILGTDNALGRVDCPE